MTRLRFSVAQSMAIVLVVGVGVAALRAASLVWASAVFTLTVLVLLTAVLAAMARRGRTRMTWAGFALFGWVYLGTTFGPGAAANGVTPPPYVTRWALDYWDANLWSAAMGGVAAMLAESGNSGEELFPRFPPVQLPGTGAPVLSPNSHHFRRIGHCLAAIVFGLVGAVLGRLLASREQEPNP
jgi:hypothetical protein